ncbi:hypothetical protein VTN96DRAFT_7452 [Rasamsonia emersonii]
MDTTDVTFYSNLAAVISARSEFLDLVETTKRDINENDAEYMTPSRSRLKIPPSFQALLREYQISYHPKIFNDSMRSLFDKTEVTRYTIPQLYSCRNGYFTFQDSAVLSVFIMLDADPNLDIRVQRKGNPTQSALIKDRGVASILIIPGNCDLRFTGEGRIIVANITYQREVPVVGEKDKHGGKGTVQGEGNRC